MMQSTGPLATFIGELRRRRVFRVAGASIAFALAVIYAADTILPRFGAPEGAVTLVIIVAALGVLIAIALSWIFDFTASGVVRTDDMPATSPQPASTARDRTAIAVLPFANMSADAENEYFSDGISEEIINALAQIPELRVAGRTSSFSFRGKDQDLRSVGEQLSVGTVLEGSVRKAGNRVRITAQLIDTSDGYHLWSERYDRDLHDIFVVQDEIARAIARTLAVKLGAAPLVKQATHNAEAYQLYLQGRHYMSQMMDPGLRLGIDAYRAAIALAPDYALAWAALAECQVMRSLIMDQPYAALAAPARAAADRALELDDTIAEAHAVLGVIRTYYDLDWAGAERAFQRALELNPGSGWTLTWYGDLLAYTLRTDASIDAARRATELDPLSAPMRWNIVQNLLMADRLDEAEKAALIGLSLFPDFYGMHFFLACIALGRGNAIEAIARADRAIDVIGEGSMLDGARVAIYYGAGRTERADELFEQLKQRAQTQHISAATFAIIHMHRGEDDEAIRCLRIGRERRDGFFASFKASAVILRAPISPALHAELDRLGFGSPALQPH